MNSRDLLRFFAVVSAAVLSLASAAPNKTGDQSSSSKGTNPFAAVGNSGASNLGSNTSSDDDEIVGGSFELDNDMDAIAVFEKGGAAKGCKTERSQDGAQRSIVVRCPKTIVVLQEGRKVTFGCMATEFDLQGCKDLASNLVDASTEGAATADNSSNDGQKTGFGTGSSGSEPPPDTGSSSGFGSSGSGSGGVSGLVGGIGGSGSSSTEPARRPRDDAFANADDIIGWNIELDDDSSVIHALANGARNLSCETEIKDNGPTEKSVVIKCRDKGTMIIMQEGRKLTFGCDKRELNLGECKALAGRVVEATPTQ